MVDLGRPSRRKGVTQVQIALAWLLAERPFIVPLSDSTKLHHVEENLGALRVAFTADEVVWFRSELASIAVVGARSRDPGRLRSVTTASIFFRPARQLDGDSMQWAYEGHMFVASGAT